MNESHRNSVKVLRRLTGIRKLDTVVARGYHWVPVTILTTETKLSKQEILRNYARLYHGYEQHRQVRIMIEGQYHRITAFEASERISRRADKVVYVPTAFATAVLTDYRANKPSIKPFIQQLKVNKGYATLVFAPQYLPLVKGLEKAMDSDGYTSIIMPAREDRVEPALALIVWKREAFHAVTMRDGTLAAYNLIRQGFVNPLRQPNGFKVWNSTLREQIPFLARRSDETPRATEGKTTFSRDTMLDDEPVRRKGHRHVPQSTFEKRKRKPRGENWDNERRIERLLAAI